MALIPQYQKEIDDAFSELQLSDERRARLQPLLERHIQVGGKKDDAGETSYEMKIVDDDNAEREDVSIATLVAETHKSIEDNSTPVLPFGTLLTVEQLQEVAAGKLTIGKEAKQTVDKDAINGSDSLNSGFSLEDVASGKTKFDISK